MSAIAVLASSCAAPEADEPAALESALGGHAGHGPAACVPVDTADTVCDGKDEDCDGAIDEDCDFDPAHCPRGYRVVRGTRGDDTLVGSPHRDCIVGFGGNDRIYGSHGDDLIYGGSGDDTIFGGTGDDTIFGGDGADTIEGEVGRDEIDGGDGNDRISAGIGNDKVRGGMCHDVIAGDLGIDFLDGDEGADRVSSFRIFNRVDGGEGTDACAGSNCEVSLLARRCDDDADCHGEKRCVVATGVCVSPNEVAFTDETCDGRDDDCDGDVDEEFAGGASTCGVGACAAEGTTVCEDGVETDSCTPGEPAPDDASCDAVDDDCDGVSDEDFPGGVTNCGTGACARTGTTACVDGSVQTDCTPGAPAASDATCDGVDDDCDGAADEHFAGAATSCGIGACASSGTAVCAGGAVHDTCTPGSPSGGDANCNGVDEDCDGGSDEHFAGWSTGCGIGACARAGVTTCNDGALLDTCEPGVPAAHDATCDGVDDDCDGATDEDYAPFATSCGEGACAGTGVTSCVAGVVHDSCQPGAGSGSDATCDAVDDDCDGTADEDYAPVATNCGEGACAGTGVTSCLAGEVHDSCAPGDPSGDDATCNGVDDDCDGATDEDYSAQITVCGVGACASMGTTLCVAGTVQDSCTPGTGAPSDFTCDGIDDDCNGTSDEDYTPFATFCGVGVCGASGASSCENGVEQDNCTPGEPAVDDATCDAFDDDCDGVSDEDYAPVPTSCGMGACAATGETLCVFGQVHDDCTPGTPAANDATCDGIDDDCSGVADEDFAPTCAGSDRVVCEGGTEQILGCDDANACNGAETCSAGVCVAGNGPSLDDGDPCTADECDPDTGTVTHTPVPTGTSCADGDICDGEETCEIGGAPGCSQLPSGVVSWWRGEGDASDAHADNHGTATGPVGFTAGRVGQAFNFTSNGHINLNAHAGDLGFAGPATIEGWVRRPPTGDVCRTIFHLRQDATHDQYLQIGNGCNGTLVNELVTWRYVNGAVSSVVGVETTNRALLLDNEWHHLAVTLDGTQTRIYIDGVLQATTVATGSNHGDWGGFAAPVAATIGATNTGTVMGNFHQGGIDELTIYDRALSPSEIAAIVVAGSAGKCGAGGVLTCTDNEPAAQGTACGADGFCDGAGACVD